MDKSRVYIAIDLKSFYASVECVERGLDPMKANLVVADTSRTEKTICLAVSPNMKKLGLKGRCRLFEVEEIIRQIKKETGRKIDYIAARPRMSLYMKYSARIYSIYLKYASESDIHVYSIDECFIDATDYLKLYKKNDRQYTPEEFARLLISDVYKETGITATAGIGSNLYLSKIAMDIIAKHVQPDENGARIAALDVIEYRRKLWNYRPITDFWRVGHGVAERLQKYSIYTMGELASFSLRHDDLLFREFGIDAEILIDHAWGEESCRLEDIKAYKPKDNSISNGQILQCPYSTDKARLIVQEMAEELSFMLIERKAEAESISLYLMYDRENLKNGINGMKTEMDYYGRTMPKSTHGTAHMAYHSSLMSDIVNAVLSVFDRIADSSYTIRKIYITANSLRGEGEDTVLDLLGDQEAKEKEKKAQKAMLEIKQLFGKNSILKASSFEEGSTARERNMQIGGHRG